MVGLVTAGWSFMNFAPDRKSFEEDSVAITGIGHLAAKSAGAVGAQFIELFYPQKEAAPDAIARIGFSHMCFLVDDMKHTEAEILKRGGALDRPIKLGKDGNYQCWLRDPDGNRIELMQIMPGSPHAKSG